MESPTASERTAPGAGGLAGLKIDRTSPTGTRRRRKGPWVALAVVVLGGGAIVWMTMGAELSAPRVKPGLVLRVSATEGLVRTSASGYVVARTKAAISSKLSGRLDKLLVDVNEDVQAGQLIGELGHEDLDASVAQAKADVAMRRSQIAAAKREALGAAAAAETAKVRIGEPEASLREMESRFADAERTLRRETELRQGGATSQDSLDRAAMERDVMARKLDQMRAQIASARAVATQAQRDAESAESRIATAEAALASAEAGVAHAEALRRDASIVAPFAGRVIRKEAEVGEMVAPVNAAGSTTRGAVITLADFSTLEMEVDVIERDISLVETGMPCRIALDSRRDSPYAGTVRLVLPSADRTKSTVQVKVAFLKLDDRVKPDMSGRVEFVGKGSEGILLEKDRVYLPKTALVTVDGKQGAFELRESHAAFRELTVSETGKPREGLVEVTKGFVGGESVIVEPPAGLRDAQLVRVLEPKK